jgi:two-component system chemotaxis sensor kinase CheA
VIDDVTERVARAREDAEQRELLAAFTALMRDRTGFMAFFEEAQSMLSQLARGDLEEALEKRLLHTLKGNAASMGLKLIAEVCHGAESELAEEGAVREETHERLRARWAEIVKTMGAVIPAESRTAIEVSEGDLRTLHDLAGQGASGPDLVEAVERLRWEPVERHLTRLAQNAQSLAERLGKEGLEIVIDSGRLRLEPERWLPLWSSLMHVVRNAVDHGIEPSDEREHAGKPRRGCLRLEARRDERELRIAIHDDGRGIDWDAVRRACEEQGRPCGSRLELLNAILSPDFSTRRNVTETSGRGIGMAAIAAVTRELGGRLAVESETGEGTRWTLSFPSPVGVADASLDSARRAFHFAA